MRPVWSRWFLVLGLFASSTFAVAKVDAVSLPNPFRNRVVPRKIPRIKPEVPTIAEGAALFARACISCHGPRGDGQGFVSLPIPVPRLDQLPVSEWGPTQIATMIQKGNGAMPAWGQVLSEREIKSLTLYVESLNQRVTATPQYQETSADG